MDKSKKHIFGQGCALPNYFQCHRQSKITYFLLKIKLILKNFKKYVIFI